MLQPGESGYRGPATGVRVDFGADILPREVRAILGARTPPFVEANLVAGKIGIAEVVFRVTDNIPEDLVACGTFDERSGRVQSNAVVSVGHMLPGTSAFFFDGVQFCVEVPPPARE